MWTTQIKWRRIHRFSQKSLQESQWILTTLDEIVLLKRFKKIVVKAVNNDLLQKCEFPLLLKSLKISSQQEAKIPCE